MIRQDLVKILKNELILRRKKNQAYSLRAFARDLGLGPTTLSDFFQRKRRLSPRNVRAVCERLMLSPSIQEMVIEDQSLARAQKKLSKQSKKAKINQEQRLVLAEEKFRFLSEWYYLAILNLAHTTNNSARPESLSKRLGVGQLEIERALDDLQQLGVLEIRGQRLVRTNNSLGTTQDLPSSGIRQMHKSFLSKAMASLEVASVREREFGVEVMAINPSRLPQAKALIHEFQDKLAACLEKGKRQKVYAYCFQLYALES